MALVGSKTFGIAIDKEEARPGFAKQYRPGFGGSEPFWLTFLGHIKDSV